MTQPAAPAPTTPAAPSAPSAPTTSAPTTPSTPAAPSTPAERSTVDDRIAKLLERRSSEGEGANRSDDGGDKPEPQRPQETQPAAPSADDDARAKARQERLARIAKIRETEDANRQQRMTDDQRRARDRQQTSEVEALRKRVAELEPLNKVFESEEALLAEAERRNMTPEKMISWMRTRLSDPSAVAQRQVKTETDALRAELDEVRKQLAERDRKIEEERRAAEEYRYGVERSQHFVGRVQQLSDSHPNTAAFLKKHGPVGTIAFANEHIAKYLPEEYELEHLHDQFETFLEAIGAVPEHAAPAPGTSHPPKNGAAQPPSTLSNSIAQERSTVEQEIPLHKMSLDDRIEFIKARRSRSS